jgi:hypothetical protein
MFSPVLAISDLGEPTESQYEIWFWEYGITAGIVMVLFSIFVVWAASRCLIGVFRLSRRPHIQDFSQLDDPMRQIADARAHLDASKRHIAALEETLNQIHDELKSRPLS